MQAKTRDAKDGTESTLFSPLGIAPTPTASTGQFPDQHRAISMTSTGQSPKPNDVQNNNRNAPAYPILPTPALKAIHDRPARRLAGNTTRKPPIPSAAAHHQISPLRLPGTAIATGVLNPFIPLTSPFPPIP